jgi:hypothetical protein
MSCWKIKDMNCTYLIQIYRILSLAQIKFLSSNFVQGRTFLSSCPLHSYFVCIKFQGQIRLWFLVPNEEGTCFSS